MIEFKNDFRIEYAKGDTYALKITFKNVTQDLTTAIFSVKENADDTTALIEKTIGSGISKVDDNYYKQQSVYKLQLQAEDSRNLQAEHLYLYDLKVAVDNVIKTVISGNFVVRYNVTSVDRIETSLVNIEVDDVIEADIETTPATAGIEYEQDPIAMAKIGDITQLNTTAKTTLVAAINETNTKATTGLEEIAKIEDGTVSVPEATHATTATSATKVQNVDLSSDTTAQFGDYIVPKKKLLWSGNVSISSITPVEIYSLSEALSPNVKAVEFICSSNANGDYSIKVPLTNKDSIYSRQSKYIIDYGFYPNASTPYMTCTNLYLIYSSYFNKFYGYCKTGEYYLNTQTSDEFGSSMNVTKIYEIIE